MDISVICCVSYSRSPVVWSSMTNCNSIRIVKNADSTDAAASPIVDNVILRTRHATALTYAYISRV